MIAYGWRIGVHNMCVANINAECIIYHISEEQTCLNKVKTTSIAAIANEKTSRNADTCGRIVIRPAHCGKRCIILFVNDDEQALRRIRQVCFIPGLLLFHREYEGLIQIAIILRVIAPSDDVRKIAFLHRRQIDHPSLALY